MLHVDLKYTNLLSGHFERFTRKNDYLFNVRCPLCGDSQTKKTKMRGYIYRDKQKLCYKCHNCHASMWLGALIKHLAPELYKEYLLETFQDNLGPRMTRLLKEPGFFDTTPTNTGTVRFGAIEPVIYRCAEKISDLPEAHYCRQYVADRQIPQEFWSKLYFTENYREFIDEIAPDHGKKLKDEPRLAIPFYDPFGAVYAVSGRALDDSPQRYITIRIAKDESKLIYGLERVDQNLPVQVVEGPLDSLFLPNTVASGDANLILTAKQLSAAQIVLIFDNEKRSPEIVKQMERAIKEGYAVVIWPDWLAPKDINAMVIAGNSPVSIQSLIHSHSFSGLTALTHLVHWKKTSNNKGILV